ncbi:hypothetical protein ACFSTC_05780 [Nonomuraea ferruginea]
MLSVRLVLCAGLVRGVRQGQRRYRDATALRQSAHQPGEVFVPGTRVLLFARHQHVRA